jgi:hypothetical protein
MLKAIVLFEMVEALLPTGADVIERPIIVAAGDRQGQSAGALQRGVVCCRDDVAGRQRDDAAWRTCEIDRVAADGVRYCIAIASGTAVVAIRDRDR